MPVQWEGILEVLPSVTSVWTVEVYVNGFEEHIRSRNEEKQGISEGSRPRRWVVERTFAWLKDFRSLRTRYCRCLKNFVV